MRSVCEFRRIQFTPDLMPSDITGTDIIEEDLETGHRKWTFVEGPIFGNILLADEINRTPPKTQSALLEAMQEHSCTVRGHIYYVCPSRSSCWQRRTRSNWKARIRCLRRSWTGFSSTPCLDDLSAEDELEGRRPHDGNRAPKIDAVTSAEDLLDFQQLVRMVPIAETLARYVVSLVRATRPKSEGAPDFVKKYANYGASVRAAQFIVLAAKARALSHKRYHVTYDDITSVVVPVLASSRSAELPRRVRLASTLTRFSIG